MPKSEYKAPAKNRGPMFICNHFEAFESPVTGEVIRNKREHLYDMHSTGSRVYEGREQETKEANKYMAEQEAKLDKELDRTLNEKFHEIEHRRD